MLVVMQIVFFFSQEPDTEICASMLDALNECVQVDIFYHIIYC